MSEERAILALRSQQIELRDEDGNHVYIDGARQVRRVTAGEAIPEAVFWDKNFRDRRLSGGYICFGGDPRLAEHSAEAALFNAAARNATVADSAAHSAAKVSGNADHAAKQAAEEAERLEKVAERAGEILAEREESREKAASALAEARAKLEGVKSREPGQDSGQDAEAEKVEAEKAAKKEAAKKAAAEKKAAKKEAAKKAAAEKKAAEEPVGDGGE